MKCVVQRVSHASVTVDGAIVARIGTGLLVLVGIEHGDDEATVSWMADKLAALRVFADQAGRMNLGACDVGAAVLSVSQFTLLGDTRKGTRPSFTRAARPEHAQQLWSRFNELVAAHGIPVAHGIFGANMDVELCNDGPVTLIIER